MKRPYAVMSLTLIACALILLAAPAVRAQIALSHFDSDRDGWIVSCDATTTIPTFIATGGNPEASSGRWTWFLEVVKTARLRQFLGNDLAPTIRRSPSIWQQSLASAQFNAIDVMLVGGGITLAFDTPVNPAVTPNWTSYSVLLDETAGWKLTNLSGTCRPMQAQFQTVLGSLEYPEDPRGY